MQGQFSQTWVIFITHAYPDLPHYSMICMRRLFYELRVCWQEIARLSGLREPRNRAAVDTLIAGCYSRRQRFFTSLTPSLAYFVGHI